MSDSAEARQREKRRQRLLSRSSERLLSLHQDPTPPSSPPTASPFPTMEEQGRVSQRAEDREEQGRVSQRAEDREEQGRVSQRAEDREEQGESGAEEGKHGPQGHSGGVDPLRRLRQHQKWQRWRRWWLLVGAQVVAGPLLLGLGVLGHLLRGWPTSPWMALLLPGVVGLLLRRCCRGGSVFNTLREVPVLVALALVLYVGATCLFTALGVGVVGG